MQARYQDHASLSFLSTHKHWKGKHTQNTHSKARTRRFQMDYMDHLAAFTMDYLGTIRVRAL